MKKRMIGFLIGTAMVAILGESTHAVNSVVVESKSVAAGASTTVGVYLTNDVSIRNLVVPLVVRTVSGSAYMTAWTPSYPASRLTGLLDDLVSVLQTYPSQNGTCKQGQAGGFGTIGPADFISPDGVLFSRGRLSSSEDLPAGTDGNPGSGTPSISIALTTNSSTGSFEIDTTCADPANHLYFLSTASTGIVPSFTKGVITRPMPHISLNKSTLSFAAIQNGSFPASQSFTISNTGPGVLDWSVSDNASWLAVSPTSGNNNSQSITVSINTTNLSPQTYNGTITVSSTNADNSPQTIPVSYTITDTAEGDMDCDGDNDAVDLAILIDIVFFGSPEVPDCGN